MNMLRGRTRFSLGLCAFFLSVLSNAALAQNPEDHPSLSDNFHAWVGWFKSDNTFKFQADNINIEPHDKVDFGNIGVDESNTLLDVQFRWNFGSERQWSLWGQYFKNKASGDSTLKEDVEWQDVVFREGTFIGAGVSFEVIRVFAGRSFIKNNKTDFGAGIGLHNLSIDAYIEGEILINDGDTGFHRGETDTSAPLPNLGAWYTYSPASKWLLHTRVDWISANIGDYDGTLWNASAGVGYQLSRHFGLDLSYEYFSLDLGVKTSDWRGGAEMTYSGPVISLTSNW